MVRTHVSSVGEGELGEERPYSKSQSKPIIADERSRYDSASQTSWTRSSLKIHKTGE